MSFHIYKRTKEPLTLPPLQLNAKERDPSLYIPSAGLQAAVNVALTLGQPLLLTGEPGTGKTELAAHVASVFGLGEPLRFNAQTTSTAKDLFYRYDALGHFQASQTQKQDLSKAEVEKRFIEYQGLGKAIKSNQRSVVLLDEIDKAPRDLPNDVLAALENLTFSVPEIGKTYRADTANRPIIILTSNSEKNLPDAFLRRVTYYHIPFPDAATLLEILAAKTDGFTSTDLQAIVDHFEYLRNGRKVKLKKNPATAELIYWTKLLQKLDLAGSKLENIKSLNAEDKKKLEISYSVLAKTKEDLAALKALIYGKTRR